MEQVRGSPLGVDMDKKEQIEDLERQIEDMLNAHSDERYRLMNTITALITQLVEVNKQLIGFASQQRDEIATLRAENTYLRRIDDE
jgi:hypothetical protein